ncbi:MAG: RHS repeat-associated core domain-containing protein [Anaerolineaceae bacterium]|nr:RHS repeat-associated core domain-containing protein [Anaerolineaceae bacterium]
MEVDGSDTTVRKTYSAGSTSLAVRTIVNETTETLNWLLSDHLGSSSITTTADGTWNSEIRYSAFGETRYSLGITPTDYRYTGQLEQKDVNLYYYNARYYDAALGRFVQADTIVPNVGNPKSYDRYTYVSNNPVRFVDPSGHNQDCGINDPYCNAVAHGMSYETYTSTPTATVDSSSGIFPESTPFDPSSWDTTIPGDQWKSEFLNAVLRHKDELPEGMSVPLMLAIASAEKGVASNWSQVHDPHNPGNTDGFFQITPDNEWRWNAGYPYNDTYGGFEGIVVDAISYLSDISENWERQGIEENFSDIPSGETVKLLLYFNGGTSPVGMYASEEGGNQDYLTAVSKYLLDSPFGCLYNDESLANDLLSAQVLLNERVKEVKGY